MFAGSQRQGRALWSASRVSAGVWTKLSTTRLSSLRTSGSWQPNLLFNIYFRCVRQTDLGVPAHWGLSGRSQATTRDGLALRSLFDTLGKKKIIYFTYLAVFFKKKHMKVKGRDWRVLFGCLASWWSKIYPLSHSKYRIVISTTLYTFFFITIWAAQVPQFF